MTSIVGVEEGTTMLVGKDDVAWSLSAKLPANVNTEGPLPLLPEVIIYWTVICAPSSNFLPNVPSPNNISYFSSCTSCIKYVSDFEVTPTILSIILYCLPKPGSAAPLT